MEKENPRPWSGELRLSKRESLVGENEPDLVDGDFAHTVQSEEVLDGRLFGELAQCPAFAAHELAGSTVSKLLFSECVPRNGGWSDALPGLRRIHPAEIVDAIKTPVGDRQATVEDGDPKARSGWVCALLEEKGHHLFFPVGTRCGKSEEIRKKVLGFLVEGGTHATPPLLVGFFRMTERDTQSETVGRSRGDRGRPPE